jgi:hypothetical protein
MSISRQVITSDEIESLKQQIVDLFYLQKQRQANIKQNIKEDLNNLVQKIELILNEIEN